MEKKQNAWDRLLSSGKDALHPVNLAIKLLIFFIFGVLTNFKYLVFGLDQATPRIIAQPTFWFKAGVFLKVLSLTTLKGMWIGFASLWKTLLDFFKGSITIGSIGYAVMVLIFGGIAVYMWVSLFFDIGDLAKGKHYPKSWAIITTIMLILVVLSPIAYMSLGGETLTSDIIEDEDAIIDGMNSTTNETQGVLTNTIDLTGGS